MFFLDSSKHEIKITGELSCKNVSEIQLKIEYALMRFKDVTININGIEIIDSSGVFMLYLIKKLANENEKILNLIGLENEAFKKTLKGTGVSNLFVERFCKPTLRKNT